MKNTTKIFILVFILGLVGILGYKFYSVGESNKFRRSTTDAKHIKGKITIGIDSWVGYFPLCSPKLKSMMRSNGYLVECVDDGADYNQRMKRLKRKKYNFAVATVDSFLINGKNHDFPGSIIMVIDESKGGDAIIANKFKFPTLDSLKNPDADYKVAFTPQSPSEHLLKSISAHFDIPRIKNSTRWRVETDGSEEALKKLKDGDVDIAVLWEPNVSKALENNKFSKLLGTEDTRNLIVDILIASNDTLSNRPEMIKILLNNYFRTLKYYQKNPEILNKDVVSATKIKKNQVSKMLKGVGFVNLYDNSTKWFGIAGSSTKSEEGLINTIQSTVDTLIDTKSLKKSPIPEGNPYILQTKSFIENLYNSGINITIKGSKIQKNSNQQGNGFNELTESQWQQLRDVGTLKIRPITFKSGTSEIDFSGQEKLSKAIKSLNHYPNFRVVVHGHTGLRGNRVANLNLSEVRAKAVRNYIITELGMGPNRLRAVGFGSMKPLPRKPGESNRAYNYRLPRVELRLVSEVF